MKNNKNHIYLTLFIKCHNNNSSAVFLDDSCFVKEILLTRFQADAVDDALALTAFQARLDHVKIRRIYAEWHLDLLKNKQIIIHRMI